MDGERTLEIAQHVVYAFAGLVVGDDDIGLERGLRIARVIDRQRDDTVRLGEALVRIAVGEMTVGRDIGADRRMHERRILLKRGERIDHRRKLAILDLDVVQRVLGEVTVLGDDERHGFADEANAVDRQRPLIHRLAQDDQKRIGIFLDLSAGEDGNNSRARHGCGRIDRQDFRVGMGRAQNGRVQRAGANRQVIREIGAAGEQCRIFDPLHRAAEPTAFRSAFQSR